MLAGGFRNSDAEHVGLWRWSTPSPQEIRYEDPASFDPTISFDSNGTMLIMVSLHSLHASQPRTHAFALMGEYSISLPRPFRYYVGVLLRSLPGESLYERIGLKECDVSAISLAKAPEWISIR